MRILISLLNFKQNTVCEKENDQKQNEDTANGKTNENFKPKKVNLIKCQQTKERMTKIGHSEHQNIFVSQFN